MRIAVFGATGSTGRSFVAQALDEGHSVVAYARHPEKLGIAHDRLTVVEGELSDVAAIERAVERADGVISLLGQGMPRKGTPIAHGTRNILAAMKKLGVRRIVVVATASAADPHDAPTLRSRFFVGIAKLLMRPAYDDVVATALAVCQCDRAWTIVRPPFLKDGPKTGRVLVGYLGDGVTGTYLTRANLADFMLKQLADDQYVGKAPIVTDA
jgi:NAD(P)-dependent dehydrogenase (short-subunit alcohol dehydrogenase family)